MVKNLPTIAGDMSLIPGSILWRRKRQHTPFLPVKFYGSWRPNSIGLQKNQTELSKQQQKLICIFKLLVIRSSPSSRYSQGHIFARDFPCICKCPLQNADYFSVFKASFVSSVS